MRIVKIIRNPIFILILVALLLRLAMYDGMVKRVWWAWDDSFYINVADNIREGNGLNLDILEYRQVFYQDSEGVHYIYDYYDHAGRPYYFAGPVYPLFLAGLFFIFDAHAPGWVHIPIIANLILLALFVIVMYLIAKELFDKEIAFWTAFVVALLPCLFWYMTALPYILFFLFVALAFYCAFKKKSWFLIGAIIGLAHLTHSMGIMVIGTFGLWCLVEKRWKDCLKLVLSYMVVLLPYMIYNQVRLGDFGLGLAIPSSMILHLLGLGNGNMASAVTLTAKSVNIIEVFRYIPQDLETIYRMGYMVSAFIVLAVIGAWKTKRNILPFVLFSVVTLVGYVYLAIIANDSSIETKYLMPAIIMIIPFAVYGFISLKPSWLIFNVVQVLIIVCAGVVATNIDVNYNKRMLESKEEITFHQWVRDQKLDGDTVILSNAPHVMYLKTGLSGVYIHTEALDQKTFDYLIDKFKPSYICIYAFTSQLPLVCRNLTALCSKYPLEYHSNNILFYSVPH